MSSQTEKSRNPLISIIRMHDADHIKTMRGNSIKKKKNQAFLLQMSDGIFGKHIFLLLLPGMVLCLANLWSFPPGMYGKVLVDG